MASYELQLPALLLDDLSIETVDGPEVHSRHPAPLETNVPVTERIEWLIVNPDGNGFIIPVTEHVFVNGSAVILAGSPQAGWTTGSLSTPGGAYHRGRWVKPNTPFASESTVTVQVKIQTSSFIQVDETWTFVTEDTVAPTLWTVTPLTQRTLRLEYNEDVQVVDLGGFTFAAQSAPAVPIDVVSATVDGSVVTLTLDQPPTPDIEYSMTVTGIADTSDNSDTAQATFVGFRPAQPDGRSFRLIDTLPELIVRADEAGTQDLRNWMACKQDILDMVLAELDRFIETVLDLERAPEPWLGYILDSLGNPFTDALLSAAQRRRLADTLVAIYRQQGTRVGIENTIRFLTGLEAVVVEWNAIGAILDDPVFAQLNNTFILGASTGREIYSYEILINGSATAEEIEQVRLIALQMQPSHTHLAGIVSVVSPTQWVLDVARIDQVVFA